MNRKQKIERKKTCNWRHESVTFGQIKSFLLVFFYKERKVFVASR